MQAIIGSISPLDVFQEDTPFFLPTQEDKSRHGSRINTDRFPKRPPKAQASSGVQGWAPLGNFLIVTPLSPLSRGMPQMLRFVLK